MPSFTDASGFTQNQNPVTLSANGTPTNGSSPVGIWLNCALSYKITVEDTNGVVIQSTDNVSCSSGGGGSTTNYWTLSGSSISNSNGSGTGPVNIGAQLNVNGSETLVGTLSFADTEATPKYAIFRAPNTMTATTTWRWPVADAVGCLQSDGAGNLSFVTGCSGGGGGGSPGGVNTDVQFNNSGALGGSGGKFTWTQSAQVLTVTAANNTSQSIIGLVGYIQSDEGFAAVNNANPAALLNYNALQAPTGGGHALSFTADSYIEMGANAGVPAKTTNEPSFPNPGSMYCDTTSPPCVPKYYNGSAWVAFATGGATSPGGSNTDIQVNTGGVFGGTGNLQFVSQELVVIGTSSSNPVIYGAVGYIQSDIGFLALPATATNYNAFQAPAGGLLARSVTASIYSEMGSNSGTPSKTANEPTFPNAGTFYCNTASSPCVPTFWNGSTWSTSWGSGGGGGSPSGPNTSVQINNGGAFGGFSSLELANATSGNPDLVIATSGSSVGLQVIGGYAQADIGFVAQLNSNHSAPLTYVAFQAPTGGVYANSIRAISYEQSGTSNGIPSLTSGDSFQAGAHYWDTGLAALRVFNGSSWQSVAFGAGAVSSVTGTANNVLVNGTSGSTQTGAITLTLPAVVGTSELVSSATTSSIGFALNNSFFLVDGYGDITSSGSISAAGNPTLGLAAYRIGNTAIIDASRNATFNTQTIQSTAANSIQTAGGINVSSSGGASGAYLINGVSVIDTSRNATVQNLTISGTCSGCSSGGVSSITGSTNQVIASASTGNVILTLPQQIGTSNSPTFAGMTVAGTMNAINVNADEQNTGTGVYQMRGVTVINSSTTFVGAGVSTTSGVGASGFNFWNGVGFNSGQTKTFTNVQINGNTCTLNFQGGILTSYSGIGC